MIFRCPSIPVHFFAFDTDHGPTFDFLSSRTPQRLGHCGYVQSCSRVEALSTKVEEKGSMIENSVHFPHGGLRKGSQHDISREIEEEGRYLGNHPVCTAYNT